MTRAAERLQARVNAYARGWREICWIAGQSDMAVTPPPLGADRERLPCGKLERLGRADAVIALLDRRDPPIAVEIRIPYSGAVPQIVGGLSTGTYRGRLERVS